MTYIVAGLLIFGPFVLFSTYLIPGASQFYYTLTGDPYSFIGILSLASVLSIVTGVTVVVVESTSILIRKTTKATNKT